VPQSHVDPAAGKSAKGIRASLADFLQERGLDPRTGMPVQS
jgi:hypothetical protein